jgi:hypothetical protein
MAPPRRGGRGLRNFMGQSTITNNTVGVSFGTGGVVSSFGNNRIIGNAPDGSPTSTIAEH